jgi:prepilin-type N-terminal cleavage/methylation domain-containing protein
MEDLPPAKILPDAVKAFNKKGFTLIEVVVATLLLAILAAGVASAFWSAQHFLSRARHRVQAFNFAMEALDRLRSNCKYTDSQMTLTTAASDADDHLESEIGTILRGDEFLGLLTNRFLKYDVINTGFAAEGYKQVIIKVHWDEPAF